MRRRQLLTARSGISVAEAARRMAKKNVGAILVVEDEQLVGIFTERDIAFRVVARNLDPDATRVADVMTRSLHTIDADEPFGCALLIMHEKRVRHLPVLDNGKLVGIVSARNALDPELEESVFEAQRREHLLREHARRLQQRK
jgi:CBS domain-containing protein